MTFKQSVQYRLKKANAGRPSNIIRALDLMASPALTDDARWPLLALILEELLMSQGTNAFKTIDWEE